MLMGVGLSAIAAIAGLIAAYIVGLVLEKYPFITLPDTYYVSHLPVQMEWYIFALVLGINYWHEHYGNLDSGSQYSQRRCSSCFTF